MLGHYISGSAITRKKGRQLEILAPLIDPKYNFFQQKMLYNFISFFFIAVKKSCFFLQRKKEDRYKPYYCQVLKYNLRKLHFFREKKRQNAGLLGKLSSKIPKL